MTNLLVWAFGIAVATIMLGSIVRRRREYLVGLLKTHVEDTIGPPPGTEAEAESEPETEPKSD